MHAPLHNPATNTFWSFPYPHRLEGTLFKNENCDEGWLISPQINVA